MNDLFLDLLMPHQGNPIKLLLQNESFMKVFIVNIPQNYPNRFLLAVLHPIIVVLLEHTS